MSENENDSFTSITAGIIVIGDEILKGDVNDTNSSFAAPILYYRGIHLRKVTVICDDIDEICNEVRTFSEKYNYVITSGGIGPTHDDVTFEGVAKAFNEPLELHPKLYRFCKMYYNVTGKDSPLTKEARVPKSSKIIETRSSERCSSFPVVNVKNVYIFPGIPKLFQSSFSDVVQQTFHSLAKFYNKEVYFKVGEESIAEILTALAKKHPNVKFGSYPILGNPNYYVKVTLESMDPKNVELANDKLLSSFPKEYIANLENHNT